MQSPSILDGNNTIPGVEVPDEIKEITPKILQSCRDIGLDFYPTIVEFMKFDDISEIASYGGFPNRYPHYSFGEEYERMSQGFKYNLYRIYEMVINTNPCYIYCLDSNTIVDHITVIAHATGHNDFFKNNIFFSQTDQNMINELANHGSRIRRYISQWGEQKVTRFIDYCRSIEGMIDPAKAWDKKHFKDLVLKSTSRNVPNPRRLVNHSSDHMNDWINPRDWLAQEQERIDREELVAQITTLKKPEKDIFGWLRDNAPLNIWEKDIISILYEESMYFSPQAATKTINEGFASWVDSEIMAKIGYAENSGIIDYAAHKAGVLGGKYSSNPYKLGYCLLSWIEEIYDKGKFGPEYEKCKDSVTREKWDKKLGLGHEKILETRRIYNDIMLINDYFDQDFCNKYEFFEWETMPNGDKVISGRDAKKIKKSLIDSYINCGRPDIFLLEANYKNKRILLLEHRHDGRDLHKQMTSDTVKNISAIWNGPVLLITKSIKEKKDIAYYAIDHTNLVFGYQDKIIAGI